MTGRQSWLISATASALVLLMVVGLRANVAQSRRDSDRFQNKIAEINENARAKRPVSLRTPITEAELNSYLVYAVAQEFPAGVTDPYVTIDGDGHLSGRATVDLNQLKAAQSSGGWLDPLAYLSGKAPVTAVGTLHTTRGTARLAVESTTISGVAVPTFLLQALVRHYTRTRENPGGISLDDMFELPAGIREIELGKGQAVIVQ